MLNLNDLLHLLGNHLDLLKELTLGKIFKFVTGAAQFKNDILLCQPVVHPNTIPPAVLPPTINTWLSHSAEIPPEYIQKCWDLFKEMVWDDEEQVLSLGDHHEEAMRHYGHENGLGMDRLTKAEQRQAVLFTLDRGVRPAYSVHLYCEKCYINYHHNFSVHDGMRSYYDGIPDIIQVAEHQFVERQLIELWTTLMLVAWTSATNCARLSNLSLSQGAEPSSEWQFGFSLTSKEVWDGFVILALLEDQQSRGGRLVVPHSGGQRARFTDAVRACNQRMRLYSQPAVTHFCDKCVRRYDNGRKVSVVVTDGITIGHPCCAIHNCHTALASNRHCFCPTHTNEELRCSIVGCQADVVPGKRTCPNPVHQGRLEHAHVAHPNDALPVEPTISSDIDDVDDTEEQFVTLANGAVLPSNADGLDALPSGGLPSTLATMTPKLRAQFGRKRTHNKQLIVALCGMIHARETFFGAKAISSVAEMIRRTYYYPGLMPDHIFYDNNCNLWKHVQDDPAFKGVGLTVDVFHFKSKHSEKDLYCDTHCNPTDFPELLNNDGGFFFNLSIAEQTNVWFSGYHSICHEMLVDKYNFFLDEMILHWNRMTYEKLLKEGRHPGYYHIGVEE
ncbi:hypothetical protein JAAARDRAFT_57079 [Jaapia argillacea MUCL 33604]|uniref:CxC6 like cysteine cluster associated with KDZ domain-containing protein n=1 Tax=Jaapia argillacea MUCL 33604 TaxID=933084 RepID=A0A067Q6K9_9AGAM|nr:hypothetical protein JAAARDRAFT_57079 [Jaapia argillacea MUCL 33604]